MERLPSLFANEGRRRFNNASLMLQRYGHQIGVHSAAVAAVLLRNAMVPPRINSAYTRAVAFFMFTLLDLRESNGNCR